MVISYFGKPLVIGGGPPFRALTRKEYSAQQKLKPKRHGWPSRD
jgi:hypothetical protein